MPVKRQLSHDFDLLALHRLNPRRYPFLLQSVAQGTASSQYDILFAFPGEEIRCDQNLENASVDFLAHLDSKWKEKRLPNKGDDTIPFSGGWFVYLGYELAAQIEPTLTLPAAEDGLPIAYAVHIPAAVIIDHSLGKAFLVAESGRADLLDQISVDIDNISEKSHTPGPCSVNLTEDAPSHYIEGVNRIRQYIVDGDVFQVNLSRSWVGNLSYEGTPDVIYQRLREHNPAPFAGLALIDDTAIISSSPERLAKVSNSIVETRPIAGTRPRSDIKGEDLDLQQELLAHPKERAEHIMLIDLERNDLGRVCMPGTVEVNELMVLESYAHVHHIVSNVRGRLRSNVTPGQVIRAVFPGGTITGCPKVRCMEIIAELENRGRGAYTGSMGYLNHDGSMDLNILIRTMVQKGSRLHLRAGAGIVADSIPENELDETRAKARGLLLALTNMKSRNGNRICL
jgi:anthranilate synthase component 1